jgi:hypothetical protein
MSEKVLSVLGFGGFLGVGSDHYPLPWNNLKYDTALGGYRVGITLEQLNGAPRRGERLISTGLSQTVRPYSG